MFQLTFCFPFISSAPEEQEVGLARSCRLQAPRWITQSWEGGGWGEEARAAASAPLHHRQRFQKSSQPPASYPWCSNPSSRQGQEGGGGGGKGVQLLGQARSGAWLRALELQAHPPISLAWDYKDEQPDFRGGAEEALAPAPPPNHVATSLGSPQVSAAKVIVYKQPQTGWRRPACRRVPTLG